MFLTSHHNAFVKRWGIGLIVVLLSCIPIFLQRSTGPELLEDTDTAFLLDVIRKEQAPFSWFVRDWPLKNHFYRPVSTLVFEADNAIYGNYAAGYGLTNALLCIACVLLLYWFLRELFDKPALATAGTVLFAFWHYKAAYTMAEYVTYASWVFLALMLLPGRRWWPPILAFLCFYFIGWELGGIKDLSHKLYDWIPGRTASTMTVFALIAMAAYVRYERVSAQRITPEVTPLDPPATKGTVPVGERPKWAAWLGVVALMSCALALGSYEQAVMLPAVLLVLAVTMRLQGLKVRWSWHIGFWALLIGYMFLRSSLIGWTTSGYQEQQLRNTAGAMITLADYVFPVAGHMWPFLNAFEDWLLLFTPQAQMLGIMLASQIGAVVVASRRWLLVFTPYLLSILAFLPMAWLNSSDFHHYHYWPMAMRAAFMVALIWIALEYVASAASRPAIRAPARSDPAPGSLPHP